jgi:protein O-GlcNAc transferase
MLLSMATISEALAIALQHHQAGQLEVAEQIYRQILQVEPNHAGVIHLLGVIAHQVGKHEAAVEYMEQSIRFQGNVPACHNNLGGAYRAMLRFPEAVASYRRALELKPDFIEALNNLGDLLRAQGKLEEAVVCYRRVLELNPDNAEVQNNLGVLLKEQGKVEEAAICYHRALQLKPDLAEVYFNLGIVLKDQGKLHDAVACFRRAVELKPGYVEALCNLGTSLKVLGQAEEAVACHRQALELKPDLAEAHGNLGNALKDQGKVDDAVACYRRALELKPNLAEVHSNLLLALQYRAATTLAELAEAHANYDQQHAEPLRHAIVHREIIRERRDHLRLGFVSPDLGAHPVGYFLVRVLENLGQEKIETICYSDRPGKDDLTFRLRFATTHWHDTVGMSDDMLAAQLRADQIDILFDLTGHTANNRLLVFARKPVPIQITWIGYEGTTGLATMDYLIADKYMVPEGSEKFYREQVLRMPDGYLCYDPPAAAPSVAPLPALKNGNVTFGSFNNLAKITPEVVAVWAKILQRMPTARLMLKYRGLDDQNVQRRYRDLFASHDIEPQRLDFFPMSSYADYLATYHQVDVVLDPFPFSGSATTCDALWMGVPVITCPGETFASRHSLSHLSNVGQMETIAHDLDEYVDLAVALASDLPRMAAIRARLREQMAASPLCDGPRFAKNFTALLREVWRE